MNKIIICALVVLAIIAYPPHRADAWAIPGIPTVNACGASTTIAGTNTAFTITIGAEYGSSVCVINLTNSALSETLSDSPICTFSRGSDAAGQDAYVTTTSSTLTLTRSSGSTWQTSSVIHVHCRHNSNHA